MKISERIGWLAGGMTAGALLASVLIGAIPLPFTGAISGPVLERLPPKITARILLGRTANTIVADSRDLSRIAHGVIFYDQPTPWGDFFCFVRLYSVPSEVVRGRPLGRNLGPLSSSDAYGLWIDPTEAAAMAPGALSDARARACAEYRDFGNLIAEGDALAASGGIQLLSAARDRARAGETLAEIDCVSRHEERTGRPCDGQAFLRSIDLKSVRWAQTVSDHLGEDDVPWRASYRLTIDDGYIDGHPALTSITVAGRHLSGMRVHSIQSVTIEREVF